MTNKNDLRTRRTQTQIKTSFLKLLKKEPFEKITISQITKPVYLSRRTFYTHYVDKYELMAVIKRETLSALERLSQQGINEIKNNDLSDQTIFSFQLVLPYIYEHRLTFQALLVPHNNQIFYYELRNLLLRIINERIHAYRAQVTAKIPPEYVQSILIDSLLGVLMVWINKPVPEKPAEFAKIISQTRLLAPLELLDFES